MFYGFVLILLYSSYKNIRDYLSHPCFPCSINKTKGLKKW